MSYKKIEALFKFKNSNLSQAKSKVSQSDINLVSSLVQETSDFSQDLKEEKFVPTSNKKENSFEEEKIIEISQSKRESKINLLN